MTTCTSTPVDTIKKVLAAKLVSQATDGDISKVFAGIFFVIGLRRQHFPTQQEDKLIFAYLRTHYGHKSLDELTLAFNLAIKGELELKPEDVKVYDQFTIAYLVTVMEAYRKWLKKQVQLIPEEKPKALPAPEITETPEERIQSARETYEATGNPLYIPLSLWPLIKPLVVLSDELKSDIRKRARLMVNEMAKEDKFLFKDKSEDQWNNRVQAQLAMEYYFKQLKNTQ